MRLEIEKQNSDAPALSVTPSRKITQDFVTQDPLSAYRNLRPYVASDGSFHLYCLTDVSGTGLPVHIFRLPDNIGGWVQEQLADAPAVDILQVAPGAENPAIVFFPVAPDPDPDVQRVGLAVPLLENGGPAGPFATWPSGWDFAIYNGLAAVEPTTAVAAPSYPATIVLGSYTSNMGQSSVMPPVYVDSDGGHFANQLSMKPAAVENAFTLLPYPAGQISMLYRTPNGQLQQWCGDPASQGAVTRTQQPPALPAAIGSLQDFSVSVSSEAAQLTPGSLVLVVAIGTAPGWFTLIGTIDPTQAGQILWNDSWIYVSPSDSAGNPINFDKLAVIDSGDGFCSLFLRDAAHQLNITTLNLGAFGQWSRPLVLAADADEFRPFMDGNGQLSYLLVGSAGIGLATRNAGTGDWLHEQITLPADTVQPPAARSIYRVGITLTDQFNVGAPDAEVTVEASTEAVAMIQGERYFLAPGRTVTTKTDGSGTVWASIEVDPTGLAAPLLTFRSPQIDGGQIEVFPDGDIHQYFKTVTADQLKEGTDAGNIPVIPLAFQDDAEAVAGALRSIDYVMSSAYERPGIDLPGVRVAGLAGVSLQALSPIGTHPVIPPRTGGRAWSFSTRSGRAVFRTLDADEVAALSNRLVAASPRDVRGLFGVDWDDVWDSVVDGITEVAEVVVHDIGEQVTAAVSFVINGIEMVVSTVLTAASQAFDLVTGIFAQLGSALGTVLGWLMKQIGYLFGWGNILSRRNELVTMFQGFKSLPTQYPYTSAFTDQARRFLTELQSDFQGVVGMVSGPADASFGNAMQSWPSLQNILGEALSPVSWVVEKLQGSSLAGGQLSALTAPSIVQPLQQFAATLNGTVLSRALSTCMDGPLGAWMAGSAALAGGKPSDLLAPLEPVIADLTETLLDVTDAFDVLARSIWSEQALGDLITYLDQSVDDIPFLSGFYEGLTEHPLSMLDVVCLVAAIIEDASGNERGDDFKGIAQDLLWAGIATRAISAGVFSFARSSPGWATFFDVIDSALCVAVSLLLLQASDPFDSWFIAAVFYLFAAAPSVMLKALNAGDEANVFVTFAGIIGLVTAIYMFSSKQSVGATVFTLLDAVGLLMSVVASVASKTGQPLPGYPASAIAYTVLQTAFATGCAVGFKLSSEAPADRAAAATRA